MPAKKLYANVTGCTGILSVIVTTSHDTATSLATIEATSTTLTLGDSVTVNIGYLDDHQNVFTGFVKQIDQKTPTSSYSITCSDVMVRAMDYFIAASDPENPLKYSHIQAEDLIEDLMSKAGLTSFTCPAPSYFEFGVSKEFEVNLVPVFEYCRAIADNLTWAIWADDAGTIHFANRKPYPMEAGVDQPGWVADTPTGFQITDLLSLDMGVTTSEKDLRNRVVVYGSGDIHAEASQEVSFLPAGFYKTAVLGAGEMVDDQNLAQTIANYNLDLFCRYTEQVRVTIIGEPSLRCRTVIDSDCSKVGITGNWYVDLCEHSLSTSGYITVLGLRRMPRA